MCKEFETEKRKSSHLRTANNKNSRKMLKQKMKTETNHSDGLFIEKHLSQTEAVETAVCKNN